MSLSKDLPQLLISSSVGLRNDQVAALVFAKNMEYSRWVSIVVVQVRVVGVLRRSVLVVSLSGRRTARRPKSTTYSGWRVLHSRHTVYFFVQYYREEGGALMKRRVGRTVGKCVKNCSKNERSMLICGRF